jgi:hypothetical protein
MQIPEARRFQLHGKIYDRAYLIVDFAQREKFDQIEIEIEAERSFFGFFHLSPREFSSIWNGQGESSPPETKRGRIERLLTLLKEKNDKVDQSEKYKMVKGAAFEILAG